MYQKEKYSSPEEKAAKINIIGSIAVGLITAIIPCILIYFFGGYGKDTLVEEITRLNQEIIQYEKTINSNENTISTITSENKNLEEKLKEIQSKSITELNEDIVNENIILKAENTKLLETNQTLKNALENNKNTIPQDAVEFEGHYYKVYDYLMDWKSAKIFCEMSGGHLVSINSSYEQYFLMDQIYLNDGIYSITL